MKEVEDEETRTDANALKREPETTREEK